MVSYVCTVCGYIYDGADGPWEDLPNNWACPLCGAMKFEFEASGEAPAEEENEIRTQKDSVPYQENSNAYTAREMSALCSNLARGYEKQYQAEEAEAIKQLSDYFKGVAAPEEDPSYAKMQDLLTVDLEEDFSNANRLATEAGDRGALRALVWTEKVSRIVKSLLSRYEIQGEALVENTDVYVCTICGFVYLGDNLPDVCPVCKVPNWKFDLVEAR